MVELIWRKIMQIENIYIRQGSSSLLILFSPFDLRIHGCAALVTSFTPQPASFLYTVGGGRGLGL
jgi:hypothetical protein